MQEQIRQDYFPCFNPEWIKTSGSDIEKTLCHYHYLLRSNLEIPFLFKTGFASGEDQPNGSVLYL